jgi:S-adenosylhomocysteine hydrolase
MITQYNERLPLLDTASALFKDTNLEDTVVLAGQHLLGSNYTMFEYLFDKGLSPQNTFLLGKCYSTHREVLEQFQERGVQVHSGSTVYDSYRSFDESYTEEVKDFFKESLRAAKSICHKRIIVIDDGGYLLKETMNHSSSMNEIVGIEQTSSGYHAVKTNKLPFPIINVARSKAKLDYESPYIGELVTERFKIETEKINASPQNILVVGNGPIGTHVARTLSSSYETHQYDFHSSNSSQNSLLNHLLPSVDAIMGCTGRTILSPANYSFLKKGAILASASSSDREFSARDLRRQTQRNEDCHQTVQTEKFTLLNSGFPITFFGARHCGTPQKMQLTRALMFSAVCQANQKSKEQKELLSLDEKVQDILIEEYLSLEEK